MTVTQAGLALRERASAAQQQVVAATGLDREALAEMRDALQALTGRLRTAAAS